MSSLQPLREDEYQEGCGGLVNESSHRHPSPEKLITKEMIIRALERQNIKLQREADVLKVMTKQTHLHLNAHHVTHVGSVLPKLMQSLEVLYLYDNAISNMDDFTGLQSLTHLYLQNNNIERIQGLSGLRNLSKLYLQGNRISVVSGLQNLPSLEELHLSNQRLPPDSEGLSFDVQAMLSIAYTLRVIVASDCGITDMSAASLPPLPQLRKLDLSNNALEVIECLEVLVKSAPRLTSAELHGNPFCKGPTGSAQKYRDAMILLSDSLTCLDGEQITEQQRSFLLRLHIKKLKQQVSMDQADFRDVGACSTTNSNDRLLGSSQQGSQQFDAVPLEMPHRNVAVRSGFTASHSGNGRGPQHVHGRRGVLFPILDNESVPPVPPPGTRGRSPSIPSKTANITLGMEGVRIN
ncbi:hypothetical protein CEUSTIGMA_g7792.t1 [Chlamydomonas eustigma]|uniref:Protein phosphatase 1 regulatory subunit 7 n=1 Tax=Chlamydomonas eustigma TaxID=1157962 RepID=A0A250XB88_9CHLO|nr:hypothetical protein CEUSTIGMA_g7792.t1 [Chlamydomonas eustigma]|eukprot:GAX80353.1 hypothetical protein CEUSTIGMA_g7792.t1 [Chlamydomonas eustigma]